MKLNGSASDISDAGTFPDGSPVDYEAPMDDGEDVETSNDATAMAI